MLPEGSTLEGAAEWSIELQDTSLADAEAVLIGADGDALTDATATEIDFEIIYDPSLIDDRFTYTLSARIVNADDGLLFINDTSIPVITNDSPIEDVEVPVDRRRCTDGRERGHDGVGEPRSLIRVRRPARGQVVAAGRVHRRSQVRLVDRAEGAGWCARGGNMARACSSPGAVVSSGRPVH